MNAITFKDICKTYDGKNNIINGINLNVEQGDFITLLGPSGCGKTTLLKMVNKLIPYDKGDLMIEGRSIKAWDTVTLRRRIGYVIQQIGLFPHMTISDNISYVLMLQKTDEKKQLKRAQELIEFVGLPVDYLSRYPRELSGGQRQRVGVARALAADPNIILMDEPFGAVDELTRNQLQEDLLKIQKTLKKTILFVTHDIQEAFKLGTKIVLLNNGNIEQMGTREELIFNPKNDFVKDFFGTKGFTAVFDQQVLSKLYDKVQKNEIKIKDIYEKLSRY